MTTLKTNKKKANPGRKAPEKIYTLRVYIAGGPVGKKFAGMGEISRTIQIRGTKTLEDLHNIIFRAFDRWEQHTYEFNLGNGPSDESALYSIPMEEDDASGDVAHTTLESLGLRMGRTFGYIFDFRDNWTHEIRVIGRSSPASGGRYPKITGRVGESPLQYPDDE